MNTKKKQNKMVDTLHIMNDSWLPYMYENNAVDRV